MEQFTDVDDCIKYFTDMGFKLVKDDKGDTSRTLTLRSYTMDEFSEVTVKERDSKISVMQTLNGKLVSTN